jgi:hypothetical protein
MRTAEEKIQMEAQIALSKSLAMGFAFSLLPVAGLGSIAAIVIGLRARKKIEASNGRLVGMGMVTWCILVGAFGLVLNLFLLWPTIMRLK